MQIQQHDAGLLVEEPRPIQPRQPSKRRGGQFAGAARGDRQYYGLAGCILWIIELKPVDLDEHRQMGGHQLLPPHFSAARAV
jgi:hypothetical protein